MTRPNPARPVEIDRATLRTREYIGAVPAAELASLEDIGFPLMALLTSLLLGVIALS
jgi:hypothetical protein